MKKLVVLVVLVCLGAVSVVTLSSYGQEDESIAFCREAGPFDYCITGSTARPGCVNTVQIQSCNF